MLREAEGLLNIYVDVNDYEFVNSAVLDGFNQNAAELIEGKHDTLVNIFINLGYALVEETEHNGMKILRFAFDGMYSPLHEDIVKWVVTNFDVYVEANYHTDDNGEHERWGFKGEDKEFETVMYMRAPSYQLQTGRKAKEHVVSLSRLSDIYNPEMVYSVEDLKKLISFPLEDFDTFNSLDNVAYDLVYTGKITLNITRDQFATVSARVPLMGFYGSLPDGENVLDRIVNLFGGKFLADLSTADDDSEVLQYCASFEVQSFEPVHMDVLNWLATVGVGVFLEACDSFQNGLLIEAEPASQVLTFQKTFDIDVKTAAVAYVRINLLNELAEHIVNKATVEEVSGLFTEFEEYLLDSGLNVSFDHIATIFEPLTVEGY